MLSSDCMGFIRHSESEVPVGRVIQLEVPTITYPEVGEMQNWGCASKLWIVEATRKDGVGQETME